MQHMNFHEQYSTVRVLLQYSYTPLCLCSSEEMMGHPELLTEYDINLMDPLLPQEVVDELLSKYLQTFTVSPDNTL